MTNNERFSDLLNSCQYPQARELLDAIKELTEDECADVIAVLKAKRATEHENHD